MCSLFSDVIVLTIVLWVVASVKVVYVKPSVLQAAAYVCKAADC